MPDLSFWKNVINPHPSGIFCLFVCFSAVKCTAGHRFPQLSTRLECAARAWRHLAFPVISVDAHVVSYKVIVTVMVVVIVIAIVLGVSGPSDCPAVHMPASCTKFKLCTD